jgi:hypothetical protein
MKTLRLKSPWMPLWFRIGLGACAALAGGGSCGAAGFVDRPGTARRAIAGGTTRRR